MKMTEMSKGEFFEFGQRPLRCGACKAEVTAQVFRRQEGEQRRSPRPPTERLKPFNPNQVEFLKSFHCVVEKKKKKKMTSAFDLLFYSNQMRW